jgi:lysophospholipase L1-like esterase
MRRLMMVVLASVIAATSSWAAQQPVDPYRWETTIQKFEAEDKQALPGKHGIFMEDGLHTTAEDYKAWTQMLKPHLH